MNTPQNTASRENKRFTRQGLRGVTTFNRVSGSTGEGARLSKFRGDVISSLEDRLSVEGEGGIKAFLDTQGLNFNPHTPFLSGSTWRICSSK